MTIKEIIDGLQMTIDLCLYNPNNGETITEPRNDMDKTTVDACKGAIELLSYGVQQPKVLHWIEHIHNGMHYIECPKCSSWFLRMYLTRNSYCPNCGARCEEEVKRWENIKTQ